jgi:Serine-pyruvate aminotransferase/archaeal aspartate aminotransferase
MNDTKPFGTFFLPGPTEVREEVMAAMMRPMIPHRGSEFEELFGRLQEGLSLVFRTDRPVFISTSSATGMMEAAIRCAPAGRILCLVNGAFSERFAHIASMCGRETDRYDVQWGQVHAIPQLEERLSTRKYAAITTVHSETSTGALNDVRAISDCAHRFGIFCLIDSVSGLAGAELRFDEWKLDYVLTGSQKAFALPPGISFAAASAEFLEQAKKTRDRGVYFDIVEMDTYARKNQTPNTPALSLLFALEVQLRNRGRRNRSALDPTQSHGFQNAGMVDNSERSWRHEAGEYRTTRISIADSLHDQAAGRSSGGELYTSGQQTGHNRWERLREAEEHDLPHWPHG